jgi:hypothetical protein
MNYLFLVETTGVIAAAKLVALSLPIMLTFLKIGIAEWKLRRAREEAKRRMASSLARALANTVLEFETAPSRAFVNVFQDDDDESERQLIASRSLICTKPWFTDNPAPVEPASKIVRVHTLGAAADPDRGLLCGVPKGLLLSNFVSDAPEENVPAPACTGTARTDTGTDSSATLTETDNVIRLPAATDSEAPSSSSTSPEQTGRRLCGFFELALAIADGQPQLASKPSKATQRNSGFLSCYNLRNELPAHVAWLAPSAFRLLPPFCEIAAQDATLGSPIRRQLQRTRTFPISRRQFPRKSRWMATA